MKRILLPLALLVLGVGITLVLVRSKPRAQRAAPAASVPRVEVVEALPRTLPARVGGTGLVQPSRKVSLSAEVSGRIVEVSDAVLPGGRLKEGALIARVDSRDYRLAIQQEESRVRAAELELQLEQGRQDIAAREWKLLGGGKSAEEAPLALRKPQLAATQQALEAARSGLERARLNLERTALRAPFNALVLTENLEVGQVVGPGNAVLTLIGTDRFWVSVSLPVEDLGMLDIPGLNAERGSRATVVQRLGAEAPIIREGEVLRLQGELDAQARTATLLVAVDRPLDAPGGGLPLLSGAYVDVELEGRPLENAIALPRAAVFDGDKVWVVSAEGTLVRRTVQVGWRTRDEVVVVGGLESGARVVTSPLSMPIEGMPVQVQASATPPESVTGSVAGAQTL
ncbi:MAG TPA: efflux RND transporter periplasmic adaptor subunit [Myxococcaceae bacterium]|nr:efflux RND transporter periplasmic adaptor subunit [Myxococcaceae bacterium]